MEPTKERLDELIEGVKKVAKLNRERIGFSGQFAPIVIAIGPKGEHSVNAIPFQDREQKALMMKALSMTARQMGVIAIVIINDTVSLRIDKFSEHYNIPQDISRQEFDTIFSHMIDTHFDGSIVNVPKELFSDALCMVMKSPIFAPMVCMMPYHEGVGDSIRWDAEEACPEAEILMLDDWWDAENPTIH